MDAEQPSEAMEGNQSCRCATLEKNGLESIITSSKDRCLCVCVFVLVKPPASACESEAKTGQKGAGAWAVGLARRMKNLRGETVKASSPRINELCRRGAE